MFYCILNDSKIKCMGVVKLHDVVNYNNSRVNNNQAKCSFVDTFELLNITIGYYKVLYYIN